jgi:hypothetical protein
VPSEQWRNGHRDRVLEMDDSNSFLRHLFDYGPRIGELRMLSVQMPAELAAGIERIAFFAVRASSAARAA